MNVLFIQPYCYKEHLCQTSGTGFGIFTVQLAEEIAKIPEMRVFMLCMKLRLKQDRTINGVTYLGMSDSKILCGLLRRGALRNAFHIFQNAYYQQSVFHKLLVGLYCAGKTAWLEEIIREYGIDLVHIHSGANELYGVFERVLPGGKLEKNTRAIVTIHGTIVGIESLGRYGRYYFQLLHRLFTQGVPLTFVSGGVRQVLIERNIIGSAGTVPVILNGTSIKADGNSGWRPGMRQILLCVGSISEGKNQTAVLECLRGLAPELRRRFKVVFVGGDATAGEFASRVRDYHLEDTVELTGFLPPSEVASYYASAFGNLLPSKGEAFGLSIIEAFQFGVPTLTYADLDAIEDLYSPVAMQLMEDRSVETFQSALELFLNRDWDRDAIREHGTRFRLSETAAQYAAFYKQVREEAI